MTQAATQHGPWPAARRAIGLGIALSAATWLAACSILPAQTPVDTYVLPSAQWQRATPTGTTGNAANTGPALRIARPVAHGVLASKRFEAVVPGISAKPEAVGPALNKAANEVAAQVADWMKAG